jgi:hypothetical protein
LDGDIGLFLAIKELLPSEQTNHWQHERLDWDWHVQKLLHENCFHIQYGVSLEDFDALVKLFGDDVVLNHAIPSCRCEQAMYPEMAVAIRTRILAGSNYDNIMSGFPMALIW